MRYAARLSAFGLALAASAVVAQPAMADADGGKVFGSVWIDTNADGVRQADEPPLTGASVFLTERGTAQADPTGQYVYDDVRPGSYQLYFRGGDGGTWTPTKSGGDSDIDPNTGRSRYYAVTAGAEVGPIDVGVVPERVDVSVADVDPPDLVNVGGYASFDVTFHNGGNAGQALYGIATLPEGLTPLSTNAPASFIDGQRVHLSSMYQPSTRIGESVTYHVVARVDKAIKDGRLVVKANENSLRDADWSNNEITRTINTV